MVGQPEGALRTFIFDQLAEAVIFAFPDRSVKAHRMPADIQHAAGLLQADPGGVGGLLGGRFAAHFLHEIFGGVPQPAQHVDHVHRDADRPSLVGNGPRDGLANPPGGVGGKFIAAAVFVLVHRPHQPRIAFLDQVQEREAPVAVFLGDRHDQPQVAAGQPPLDRFVVFEIAPHVLQPVPQAAGAFHRHQHQVPQLATPFRQRCGRQRAGPCLTNPRLQFAHTVSAPFQLSDQGLDASGPEAQLFHQRQRLAAAAEKTLSRGDPVVAMGAAADQLGKIGPIAVHHLSQRGQV